MLFLFTVSDIVYEREIIILYVKSLLNCNGKSVTMIFKEMILYEKNSDIKFKN